MQANVITGFKEWRGSGDGYDSAPKFYHYDYKAAMEVWFAEKRDAER
jgi:hypothetical protein